MLFYPPPGNRPQIQLGCMVYIWQKLWPFKYRYTPLLGRYDSSDPAVADQHFDWLRRANVDFAVYSWKGGDAFHATCIENYRTRPTTLPWCVAFESQWTLRPEGWGLIDFTEEHPVGPGTRGDVFVKYMKELVDNGWVTDPNYRLVDGRPLVIQWAFVLWRNWAGYVDQVHDYFESKGLKPPLFVGEIQGWEDPSLAPLDWDSMPGRVDYVSRWTPWQDHEEIPGFFATLLAQWRAWKEYAATKGVGLIPAVLPGFDVRDLWGATEYHPRRDGQWYSQHLLVARDVLDEDLPIVWLTSFNLFEEGSQIEPAVQYGSFYLDLTAELKQGRPMWVGVGDLKQLVGDVQLLTSTLGLTREQMDRFLQAAIRRAQEWVVEVTGTDYMAELPPAHVKEVTLRIASSIFSHAVRVRKGPVVDVGGLIVEASSDTVISEAIRKDLRLLQAVED